MDNFYEQLVTTRKTTVYSIANGGTYAVGVLGVMMVGSSLFIEGLLFIAIAVGIFFLKKKLYVEYEYDFTNGEIDVDKIIEMKSRKRILSFNVKDIELLAPLESDPVRDFGNKPEKVLKVYPTTSEAKLYVAMITGGENRVQLIFVPDEKLIELCYKYNPRAVKKFL